MARPLRASFGRSSSIGANVVAPARPPAAAPGDTTHGAAILQDELYPAGAAGGRKLARLSGEFVVATVTRDKGEQGQWLWTVTALKRPKGWRKGAGHRTSVPSRLLKNSFAFGDEAEVIAVVDEDVPDEPPGGA